MDGGMPLPGEDPPPARTFGEWRFDDCKPFRTELRDFSGHQNDAFRAVAVACGEGVAGQAVVLAAKEDIVYGPDQPGFTVEGGLTVAGWFKPTSIKGTRTLIRKRDKGTSSFALVLNNSTFQIVVNLGGDRAATVSAPRKARA